MACGILVPWPGIEPVPPALEAWSLNHWTTREVPVLQETPLNFLLLAPLLPPLKHGSSFRFSTWQQFHSHPQLKLSFSDASPGWILLPHPLLNLLLACLTSMALSPSVAWTPGVIFSLLLHLCTSVQNIPPDCGHLAHKRHLPFTCQSPLWSITHPASVTSLPGSGLSSHVPLLPVTIISQASGWIPVFFLNSHAFPLAWKRPVFL